MQPQRRSYSKSFKVQVIHECAQPGASIASVALSHSLNANLVHKWIRVKTQKNTALQPAFIPLPMQLAGANSQAASSNICVEIPHPRGTVKVSWRDRKRGCLRDLSSRPVAMIRIDSIWLATEPMDMRAGTETALVRAVAVFGAAQPHCAYLFANRRANRMKVLVHDGLGIWLAARRLHQGKFFWPGSRHGSQMELGAEQLHALVLGLPWQRVGPGSAISII